MEVWQSQISFIQVGDLVVLDEHHAVNENPCRAQENCQRCHVRQAAAQFSHIAPTVSSFQKLNRDTVPAVPNLYVLPQGLVLYLATETHQALRKYTRLAVRRSHGKWGEAALPEAEVWLFKKKHLWFNSRA